MRFLMILMLLVACAPDKPVDAHPKDDSPEVVTQKEEVKKDKEKQKEYNLYFHNPHYQDHCESYSFKPCGMSFYDCKYSREYHCLVNVEMNRR